MKWKTKAYIQNLIASVGPSLADRLYYFIQRHLGILKTPNPVENFRLVTGLLDRLSRYDHSINGKKVLEIGTGRRINIPLGLWLCGAAEVVTVDLNRYLKEELVFEDIDYIRKRRYQIIELFGRYAEMEIFQERLDRLVSYNGSLAGLLEMTNIKYLPSVKAADLDIAEAGIDYHISLAVLEHVPPEEIVDIFNEGRRILKPAGLFVHCIDFSDHFAYSDKSLSSVNFLQFSQKQWQRYGSNKYAYHNRLRADEFGALLGRTPIEVLSFDTETDPAAQKLLEQKQLPLDERFSSKPADINAICRAWLVGRI